MLQPWLRMKQKVNLKCSNCFWTNPCKFSVVTQRECNGNSVFCPVTERGNFWSQNYRKPWVCHKQCTCSRLKNFSLQSPLFTHLRSKETESLGVLWAYRPLSLWQSMCAPKDGHLTTCLACSSEFVSYCDCPGHIRVLVNRASFPPSLSLSLNGVNHNSIFVSFKLN